MKFTFRWGRVEKQDIFNPDLSQTKLKLGLGATDHLSDRDNRLYRVIHWTVVTDPLGRWLEWLLGSRGYFGGDPGFLIEYILSPEEPVALGHYEIWCDPDEWGETWESLAETEIYSVEDVRTAIKETLLAYGVEYPEHQKEALEVIKRYQL